MLGTFLVCGVNMAPQPLLYPKNLIDLVLSVLYPDLGFTPRLGLTSNKGVLRLPGSVSTVLCVLANERERERKYGRSLPGSVTLDLLRGAKRRGGEFDRKQSLMLSCGTLDLPRGAKRPRR